MYIHTYSDPAQASTQAGTALCLHDYEPQLPWLRVAIYHMGLDVNNESHPVQYVYINLLPHPLMFETSKTGGTVEHSLSKTIGHLIKLNEIQLVE